MKLLPQYHIDFWKYAAFRSLIKRIALPIIVVRMIDIGVTIEQIALISAIGYVVSVITEIPSGALSDQMGHKKALIVSMFGQAASMALYMGPNFYWMLSGTVLYFLAGSLMTGTHQALFYERLVSLDMDTLHAKLSGKSYAYANAFGIIVLPLSSWLYTVQWAIPFLLGILQFVFAAYIIHIFGDRNDQFNESNKNDYEGILASYRHIPIALQSVYSNRLLFVLMCITALITGVAIGSHEFHQVILENSTIAIALFGSIYSLKRIISAIISHYADRIMDYYSVQRIYLISMLFVCIELFGVYFAPNNTILIIALISTALPLGLISIASNHYKNTLVTSESRSTTLSVSNFMRTIIISLTALCIGYIAPLFSVETAFALIGIPFVCIATILMIYLNHEVNKQHISL